MFDYKGTRYNTLTEAKEAFLKDIGDLDVVSVDDNLGVYRTSDGYNHRIERVEVAEKIDLTPHWQGIMPALILVLERGTVEGKEIVKAELMRLAKAVDDANATIKEAKGEKA